MKIDLYAYPLPARVVNGTLYLWDPVRKKALLPRPEECIRQLFLSFLIDHAGVPPSLIGVETAIKIPGNSTAQRMDIVVYEAGSMAPLTLVELKRPGVRIDFRVFSQLQKYAGVSGARQWVGAHNREMLVFTREDRSFCESDGLNRWQTDDLVRPGFDPGTWQKIIDQRGFEDNAGEWAGKQYRRGRIGKDGAAVSRAGLAFALFLRDKSRLLRGLKTILPTIRHQGWELLSFAADSEEALWTGIFVILEVDGRHLALGTGPDEKERICLRAVFKEGDSAYRFVEKRLADFNWPQKEGVVEDVILEYISTLMRDSSFGK